MNNPFENAPFVPANRTRSGMAIAAMRKQKRNETLGFIAVALAFGLLLPLACYVAVTAELCAQVERGVYDKDTQAEMKLGAKACAKPWYARM